MSEGMTKQQLLDLQQQVLVNRQGKEELVSIGLLLGHAERRLRRHSRPKLVEWLLVTIANELALVIIGEQARIAGLQRRT